MKGAKLYLVPNLLGEAASIENSLPAAHASTIKSINHFAVEHLKNSRRFLVKCGLKAKINQSTFYEINKHSPDETYSRLLKLLKKGESIGIISDAGCPGIADPGTKLVELAHQNEVEVIPLIGPSSILLALIGSGFNGQSFTFHGYLPREKSKRINKLKAMEEESIQSGQTQIFMETPYRNSVLFEDALKSLKDNTSFCTAVDLSLPTAEIKSMPIQKWKKRGKPNLHKRPAIFLLSA